MEFGIDKKELTPTLSILDDNLVAAHVNIVINGNICSHVLF